MKYLLILLLLSGCVSMKYDEGSFEYSSLFKKANDVNVIVGSPEKVISVSIGQTSNDQVFEQIGEIISGYK
jgi:hypothetical protein